MKIHNIKEVVVIGDVHGVYNTLLALIDKIKDLFPNTTIVSVGDLVDRGPRSKDVVEYIINNKILCVKGNHEQMMHTDLDKSTEYPGTWNLNGGVETRYSYNGNEKLMHEHSNYMKELPYYIEFPDCKNDNGDILVISHSSIQDYWENRDNSGDDIMWNRNKISESKGLHQGIFNIFGHTPTPLPQIGKFHANIDTGCVFKRAGYNNLTALHYPSMTIIQQENIE